MCGVKCQNSLCYESAIKGFNQCYEHVRRELIEHEGDEQWIKKFLIQRPYKVYKLKHYIKSILESHPNFLKEFPHTIKQLRDEGWKPAQQKESE